MRAIDVSEFQGDIDWGKVRDDGIEAVVIRAGYGRGNVDDKYFANIEGAIDAGLHVGVYWFSYAYNDDMAQNEAKYICGLLDGYDIDMPVFFDWEYDSMNWAHKQGVYPDRELISTMTRAFCEEVERNGYTAGYYLNMDYAENYYNEEKLAQYKRWFARWTDIAQEDCYLWQDSDKGRIDGISGAVDTDILWGDLTPSKKETDEEPQEPAEAPETPQSDSESYYKVGDVYTVDVRSALNVRTGAGLNYGTVGYYNLTPDGRAHANSFGALLPNTRVTCLDVKEVDGNTWIEIPSGWVCAVYDGNRYVV